MSSLPRLLQVCNVGRIMGGTAACAWTVTKSLPGLEHHVLFLSPPDGETLAAFAPAAVSHRLMVSPQEIKRIRPDIILLHNTPSFRLPQRPLVPTVQYLHSTIRNPAAADVTVCCSRWLAEQAGLPRDRVLWQAVPKIVPRRDAAKSGDPLIVGRICTPQLRKWPVAMVPFYKKLANRLSNTIWEFVGCPEMLQGALQETCQHRCVFHSAGWRQRAQLSRWDVMLYCHPGLSESFGRTAAEAMRAGCVPVVDRMGGFVEQIPESCGFLCRGVEEFAGALMRLSEEAVRTTLSEQAQAHADARFSLQRFAREILNWFDRAVNERGCESTIDPDIAAVGL